MVCQGDLNSATQKQALAFAEGLGERGHAVMLSLHGDPATAAREGADRTPGVSVHFHRFRGARLHADDLAAARAFQPTLIHAFNPRIIVVTAACAYARATNAPVFVHWEDDEWGIRQGPPSHSPFRRVARLGRRVLHRVAPRHGVFITPRGIDWIRRNACAFDALTPALADEVNRRVGRECRVIYPISLQRAGGANREAPAAPDLPRELEGRPIVAYTGHVQARSVEDLELALRAIAKVQARGHDAVLLHAGRALPRFDLERLAQRAGVARGSAVFLGYQPFERIPPLLERAAIVIQPGRPNDFNRLRLPAKLQAYLESGTPTIAFSVGFGEQLEDRRDVLKLHGFDPDELAARIIDVLEDPKLAATLAAGARAAGSRFFDPDRNTEALIEHYRQGLAEWATAPNGTPAPAVREPVST